eukprot:scaffold13646_cov80-Skeletonema_menzelii.AAC.1
MATNIIGQQQRSIGGSCLLSSLLSSATSLNSITFFVVKKELIELKPLAARFSGTLHVRRERLRWFHYR